MAFDGQMREKAYRVALSRVRGIGSATLKRLIVVFGTAQIAWEASRDEWIRAEFREDAAESFIQARKKTDPMRAYELLCQQGIHIFCLDVDGDYPGNLRQISNPPMVLYSRGKLTKEDARSLAVVGTRKPTSYGIGITKDLVEGVVTSGFTIVSGLARGVDITAHRVAVESGGRTIGVLGGGIDSIYPVEHKSFVESMLKDGRGAIISDLGPGEVSLPGHFAARNRYIAGLARGLLVVEGAEKSGTRITSDHAFMQNRPVFAVPGQNTSVMSQGPLRLIQEGATIVRNVNDILTSLDIRDSRRVKQKKDKPKFESRIQKQIWELLHIEQMNVSDMARKLRLSVAEINVQLTIMELSGIVIREGEEYRV